MLTREVNFDGLIGPSHNYSGLSVGNLACQQNAQRVASPRKAALQGLTKMSYLQQRGYVQGFFPPQQRPRMDVLRRLGFSGNDQNIIAQVARRRPELLSLVYSASSMWAANAATVSASADTPDGRIHFTPANLMATPHRTIEAEETLRSLKTLFSNREHFEVHAPLPGLSILGDEGAANHNRLCPAHGERSVYGFVYGRELDATADLKFPARQTRLASEAIARQHGLRDSQCVFIPQSSAAINAGAFHNDVVAVANENLLFFHEQAFALSDAQLQQAFENRELELQCLQVPRAVVSLSDAVQSYLFNSQLLSQPDSKGMLLLAPVECRENAAVSAYVEHVLQDNSNPIQAVEFLDLRESMRNGGGPACLRLRVVMTEQELQACRSEFLLTPEKITLLKTWVERHYRDELHPSDLADPALLQECYQALDDLTGILGVAGYYDFQKE